jgi:hypothetical protein
LCASGYALYDLTGFRPFRRTVLRAERSAASELNRERTHPLASIGPHNNFPRFRILEPVS